MPFVAIAEDGIELSYRTNFPDDDVTRLDPNLPTILLLHPLFLDSTFVEPQFAHFRAGYNLIAFDQVSAGQTRAPLDYTRDAWADAALLARAHELLRLPPCHVFASQNLSVNLALRFAILWPHKCLSLALVSIPTDRE